ncbi:MULTISPECIES: glycoside hydrolase family 2 protein [Bacteroides]|uniref:glycoside hydrolase family 2 protein n=1 Tax=Bacteroides TaxID=816 RepID=UPI00189CD6FA|nr:MULTISPECIES: glycoside hydrolase family 2 TIM barrel-domain containing protein [Bacteroides]MDC2613422.1 beta galactosidase jelly roll domain-containing protein [Bacteroides ovatus]MDC2632411.1 beta galactosidase jelly roll domain-containing protein [Bacteroides ovatus]
MQISKKTIVCMLLFILFAGNMVAQNLMTNVYGRDIRSLNGKWNAIIDLYDQGRGMKVYRNQRPKGATDFYEYSFKGGLRLNVPGDWNSQMPELKYYEGTVWYARHFDAKRLVDKRQFLYFGAVSYRCRVYLNGTEIGSHEGGFTPFQIEVTDLLNEGDNFIVVEVNNRRTKDAIPAMSFDWWNYGGVTRDVLLVTTPQTYLEDYFIQLDKESPNQIIAKVHLSDKKPGEKITIAIPELKTSIDMQTDAEGKAEGKFNVKKLQRWSPENPKLYEVIISSAGDCVKEQIGFRNITVKGTDIYLNGKPAFMCSISFHEEIPQRMGRAFSEADAAMLLDEAKALGVNMIRLAHYPQNEYTVRLAEKMGFILWQEIPIWQGIDFIDNNTRKKAQRMLTEMIKRDQNRCAVGYWGIANETQPSKERNEFLTSLLETGKKLDTTRLYVAAFDLVRFNREKKCFVMEDSFTSQLDVVAVNKYMGWYHPWPIEPENAAWKVIPDKPLIISEFGGEALYGQSGDENVASSWSEEYQARLYRDNIRMFDNIPNLRGVSPWILFDFRSPFRFHPTNQDGWNRKGLISDQGMRKKAWYLMKDYYKTKAGE